MKLLLALPAFRRVLLAAVLAGGVARALPAESPDPVGLNAPWRVIETQRAIFPPRLLQQGVRHGEVRVRVSIDADGRLLDALVIYSTHADFSAEALRMVQLWRYRAALERGEFVGVIGDIQFEFRIDGTVGIARTAFGPQEELPGSKGPNVYRAESLQNLDALPAPTHVVPPSYPENWSDRGIRGTALVEFFIDEEGRVRMPVVSLADHPLLGGAALAAVMQWRFAPPTAGGRRVLVRAEQLFTFEPPKKK